MVAASIEVPTTADYFYLFALVILSRAPLGLSAQQVVDPARAS